MLINILKKNTPLRKLPKLRFFYFPYIPVMQIPSPALLTKMFKFRPDITKSRPGAEFQIKK
jgi:hypothetical protein